MDSDWTTSLKEINGINLANYLPQQRSCNSVVYVHKKFFEKHHTIEEKQQIEVKKDKRNQHDKSQQFNIDISLLPKAKLRKIGNKKNNDDSVLEQTIKFAKNIVPLVLPSNDDKSQVFYTVKTAKKRKNREKRPRQSSFDCHESFKDKEKSKKVIETYRKESISIKESFSHSSNNTLDDLNINQSLCCTFSETSEKKYTKSKSNSKKPSIGQTFAISESFEALATENTAGDAKIKVHLMNEKDKNYLSDSIKEPILNAIREYLSELKNINVNSEVSTILKFLKCNSQKLDHIVDKITYIEKKLEDHHKEIDIHNTKNDITEKALAIHEKKLDKHEKKLNDYKKSSKAYENMTDDQDERRKLTPKLQEMKAKAQASTLENLAEDLIEIKDDFSSEEELHHELLERRSRGTLVEELENEANNTECLGGGEVLHSVKGISLAGTKLERPRRIPTRFCWTDASKIN